LSDIWWRTRTQ